jgi:membrane glycosyltransferase
MTSQAAPEPSFRISADQLLQDWKGTYERVERYLATLGVEAPRRRQLALRAIEETIAEAPPATNSGLIGNVIEAARKLVLTEDASSGAAASDDSGDPFLTWRLQTAMKQDGTANSPARGTPLRWGKAVMRSMPEIIRTSMRANRFQRRGFRRLIVTTRTENSDGTHFQPIPPRPRPHWLGTALRRRTLLAVLVLIPSVIATSFMLGVLPLRGRTWLEVLIALFFGALFGWISIGFWTAVLGFFVLLRRRGRFAITNRTEAEAGSIDPQVRTAILMPICEEPVDRVFAGLKAMYRSLERTGQLDQFDFFILSDSSDPNRWVDEEMAWFAWCRSVAGFGRIFYRHRRARIERKSGNIADFCARWGAKYRYAIMLDADSVMSGKVLVQLVHLMEQRPNAGMIQTAPVAVNHHSLFARIQQFASRVYGPMFAAGLHYWQLGEGQYWGHNAIIRLAPFMEHCALPRLPGKPPLGGEILSHDFVEAALMGRAGWELWLAFDLEGSYEETSSSLLEEMTRDRRWCQGNLQHLRLVFTRGLHGAHRALFLNGALSYVSALLWFGFLTLSTTEAIREAIRVPEYFPSGRSLFPEWPIWRPDWALWLLATTGAILFLPKFLSILLIMIRPGGARSFGGIGRLTLSVLLEIALSALFAPIRMVFHARFVATNLMGRTVAWRSSAREDTETTWRDALRQHGIDTLWATAWGTGVYWLNPHYFWWLTPIIVALILSVPLSVITSWVGLGDRTRRLGLFLIPEEKDPPAELRDLAAECEVARQRNAAEESPLGDGFVRAVVDPTANAIHRALLGNKRSSKPSIRDARQALAERALRKGPAAINAQDRRVLLFDPDLLGTLHRAVWQLDAEAARAWGLAPPSAAG